MGLRETFPNFFGGSDKQQAKSSQAEAKNQEAVKLPSNVEDNLKFLSDQTQRAGFGTSINEEVTKNVAEGKMEFAINYAPKFGQDKFAAVLNFKQSDKGIYFFNNFEAYLKDAQGEVSKQTFYQNRPDRAEISVDGQITDKWVNSNFDVREAFNMMEGRSVQKDFVTKDKELYTAWASLNFEEKDKNENFLVSKVGNYDLESELKNLPIKDIDRDDVRAQIMSDLQKGEVKQVAIMVNDKPVKYNLAAAPRIRGVNVYDQNMARVKQSEIISRASVKTESAKQTATAKQVKNGEQKAKPEKQKQVASQRTARSKGIKA